MRLKKIAALVMAAALAVSMFTSCGWDEEEEGSSSSSSSSSSTSDNNSSGGGGSTGGSSTEDDNNDDNTTEDDQEDDNPVVPSIDIVGTTEASTAVADNIQKQVVEFINYGLTIIPEIAQGWLDDYRSQAKEDGITEEEQATIDLIKEIVEHVNQNGLTMKGVTVDLGALDETVKRALDSLVDEMSKMESGEELLRAIIDRVAALENWPDDQEMYYYIDVIPSTNQANGVTQTAGNVADMMLKCAAIEQTLSGYSWKYETGVVTVVENGVSYYVVLFAGINQQS